MKKKLLEKDAFYLSLFICICIIAVGGIWFTNKNVDNLLSNNTATKSEDEIHLTKEKKKDVVPTTTDSEQNLSKAREAEHKKINYLGNQVVRSYSDKEPSYSETGIPTSEFEIVISQDDTYTFTVPGHKAKGSVSFIKR